MMTIREWLTRPRPALAAQPHIPLMFNNILRLPGVNLSAGHSQPQLPPPSYMQNIRQALIKIPRAGP